MKTLILDCEKWVCGSNFWEVRETPTCMGRGDSALLNVEGYRCCLGQWAPQINKELSDEMIEGVGGPDGVGIYIPFLNSPKSKGVFRNTRLSRSAMRINDNPTSSVAEKIQKLRELLLKNNFKLRVINNPLKPKKEKK